MSILDDDEFIPEAREVLEELVRGSILQCMVTAIEGDGVPYVVLTKLSDKGRQVCIIYRLYEVISSVFYLAIE